MTYRCVTYLLQPKNGGMAQLIPMNQVKATAARAWLLLKLKAPNGLQITRYLSKDKTAKDQAVTSPEDNRRERNIKPTELVVFPTIAGSSLCL